MLRLRRRLVLWYTNDCATGGPRDLDTSVSYLRWLLDASSLLRTRGISTDHGTGIAGYGAKSISFEGRVGAETESDVGAIVCDRSSLHVDTAAVIHRQSGTLVVLHEVRGAEIAETGIAADVDPFAPIVFYTNLTAKSLEAPRVEERKTISLVTIRGHRTPCPTDIEI